MPRGVAVMLGTYVAVTLPLRLVAMWRMGLYARLWRYAGQADLEHLCAACAVLAAIGFGIGFAAGLVPGAALARVPLSVMLLDALLARVQDHAGDGVAADALLRVFAAAAEPLWGLVRRWLRDGMPVRDTPMSMLGPQDFDRLSPNGVGL